MIDRKELKSILKRVLTLPTAPFYEQLVAAEIDRFAEEQGLERRKDRFGNRVLIYKPKGRAKKGRIGFTAHMDHPGFEIVAANDKTATAKWWGGVWRPYFPKARVVVQHDGRQVPGRVVKIAPKKDMPNRVDTFSLRLDEPVAVGDFGQWDLPFFKMSGALVTTRAADDLCSVAALLALFKELKKRNIRQEVWGVFTRAEENGFNGAQALLDAKTVPKDIPLVVLETSKELPGATQGAGPVIRLGDRITTYSTDLLLYMEDAAKAIEKDTKRFHWQRRVMDGGMCEASLFVVNGYTTAGIAFPLGNYHNMGVDETNKPKLKAETVHIADLQSGVELMVGLCERIGDLGKSMGDLKKRLEKHSKPFYRNMKENPI